MSALYFWSIYVILINIKLAFLSEIRTFLSDAKLLHGSVYMDMLIIFHKSLSMLSLQTKHQQLFDIDRCFLSVPISLLERPPPPEVSAHSSLISPLHSVLYQHQTQRAHSLQPIKAWLIRLFKWSLNAKNRLNLRLPSEHHSISLPVALHHSLTVITCGII